MGGCIRHVLGCGSINTFPLQRGERSVVYEVRDEESWRSELWKPLQLTAGSQFCTGLEHGNRRIAIVNIRYQETSSENTAEEWPLLRAVTKQRLVKTLQTGEDLACSVMWIFEIAISLQVLVISNVVYGWSVNLLINPYPVYSHTPKSWQCDRTNRD
jgi:hypothetical protein